MIDLSHIYQMTFLMVVGVVMTTTMIMTMMAYMMDD
tara:strand:- start:466 stop:573 length:108 start_codon:yes stop_codon:yes gene_type:complete